MLAAVNTHDIIWISIVLVALLVAGIVALIWIKRRFGAPGPPGSHNNCPFTLEQLRRMQSQGQISEQEYQNLKDQIIRQNQPVRTKPTDNNLSRN